MTHPETQVGEAMIHFTIGIGDVKIESDNT